MAVADPLSQMRTFRVNAPASAVLGLFTAEGERRWAAGWEPELLSGDDGRGSVFRTRDSEGRVTHWIVVEHDRANGRVSYARLADGLSFGLVDVACAAVDEAATDVSVRYTLTGLDEQGRRFVGAFLEEGAFTAMIAGWERAVNQAAGALVTASARLASQ